MKKTIAILTVVLAACLAPAAQGAEPATLIIRGGPEVDLFHVTLAPDGRTYTVESNFSLQAESSICWSSEETGGYQLHCKATMVLGFKIEGGEGNDLLELSPRVPVPATLIGGAGDDVLEGGAGSDMLTGGPGVDGLKGNAGADTLYGGGDTDRMGGGYGTDHLVGGPAHDAILGGPGNDSLIGDKGPDRLQGGTGADLLLGGPGLDDLFGASGPDHLIGGPGVDHLAGGPGKNILRQ
jgi:hypothetical protein